MIHWSWYVLVSVFILCLGEFLNRIDHPFISLFVCFVGFCTVFVMVEIDKAEEMPE